METRLKFYSALAIGFTVLMLCAFAGPRRSAPHAAPSARPYSNVIVHNPEGLPRNCSLERDVVYRIVDDVELHVDVITPPGSPPCSPFVVWFHPGGFVRGERWPLGRGAAELLESGFVVATVEYRLAPRYRWPAPLEDAREAILFLRRNASRWSGDPRRIGVWGHSVGGTLAELLALDGLYEQRRPNRLLLPQESVQAAVALSGRADFLNPDTCREARQNFTLVFDPAGGSAALRDASPFYHIGGDPVAPLLLIHGRNDRVVPVSDALRMNERLTAEGHDVELDTYDAGHEVDVAPGDITEHIVDFFVRTLQP